MRLVCPNCDAQYEVADTAIPDAGRDVQCSNCGHAWFQMPPVAEAEAAEEAALFGDDIAAAMPEEILASEQAAPADAPPTVQPPASAAFADDGDPEEFAATVAAPAAAEAKPRGLDESLLAVLREEAEREVQARQAEATRPLETQTEMGLSGTAAAATLTPTQKRLAMLKGEDPEPAPTAGARPAARRDLLPDVEEINSTLRSSNEARSSYDDVDALPDLRNPRKGFRSGFLLTMILAVAIVVAYVAAPRLSEQFPAAATALRAYVTQVDAARVWLNGLMDAATSALRGGI